MSGTEQSAWYALHVAVNKEKHTTTILSEKGYECFLPVYTKRTTWSDRIKVTSPPLFSGYVFSRFDITDRLPVLVTPNVYGIVGAGKLPIAIPEHEIQAIRVALDNGMVVEPYENLHNGDIVRVTKGPLTGVEGSFVRYQGRSRLVLSLALINRSVAVELDRLCVEPCARMKAKPVPWA
jgi:transcription antitermination factor NusG